MTSRMISSALLLIAAVFTLTVDGQDAGYRLPTFQEFLVIAPRTVRPNQIYEVHVTLNRKYYSDILFTALLSRDDQQYTYGSVLFTDVGTKFIQLQVFTGAISCRLKVPITVVQGHHKLVVEGLVQNSATMAGVVSNVSDVLSYNSYLPIFRNSSNVIFDPKYISIFIVTDRPGYVVPSTVQFRIVGVTPSLLPAPGSMTIYVQDAKGNYVRRWIQKQLNFGMYQGGFDIEYPVNVGQWNIVVDAFGYHYNQSFEVRFWWWRSFEINVTVPMFMYDSEWGVMGLLYGEHVSGEPAFGTGNITLKVKNPDGTFLPGQLFHNMGYMYSTKSFTFSLAEITKTFGSVVGKDLYFIGTMYDYYYLESLSGTAVTHVFKDGIKLGLLGRPIRTFKPGVPFNIQAAVKRADGTKYDGFYNRQVVVTVSGDGASGKTNIPEDKIIIPDTHVIDYVVHPGHDDRVILISMNHPESGQTVDVRCYRYFSAYGRYLALTMSTQEPVTESYMTFTVRANFDTPTINYLISAGGSILLGSQLVMNTKQKTFAVALSRQMAPAAHILAYCIKNGEVVTDSLTFFIRDSRLRTPKIIMNYGKDFTRDTIEVLARGPPGGYVAISAVDYEFMMRGALPFITEQKVVHELLSYDRHAQVPYQQTWYENNYLWEWTVFYPAADTGMDTNTTLQGAGLVIMSDTNITIRQDFSPCNRSLGLGICPSAYQCYELSQACDGIIQCSDGYDEIACPMPADQRYYPRPSELNNLMWNSRFQDNISPFWQSTYIKQVGQGEIRIQQDKLMDPLVLGAYFMHPDQGFSICNEWIQHDTTRMFFVTVEHPDAIRRGEQIGLRLDIYNYWDQDMDILVLLHGDPDYKFIIVEDFGYVVSYAPRTFQGDVQSMVSIKGNKVSTYIMLPIVPVIQSGDLLVRISTFSSQRIDYEEVYMKVTYDGVIGRIRHTPYLVDLVNSGSLIIPDLKINISERFIDPGARDLLYIPYSGEATLYVYGDMVSPGIFADHLNAENTAYQPHDSAEGYIFEFAVNLQTISYLQTLNLLKTDELNRTLEYMQTILARQLAYMNDDGSIKMFRRTTEPNLRITSLVLKSLHAALVSQWAEIVYVDVEILNKIATWITSQQSPNGMFAETSDQIYDRSFNPNSTDNNNVTRTLNIATTAHVVISLALATRLTGAAKQSADRARTTGANYLASQLGYITDPFQMCITAYALQVAANKDRDTAYNLMKNMALSNEYTYWATSPIAANPSERINNVEFQYERQYYPNVGYAVSASSYAMLCYLAHNEIAASVPIMKFIDAQHYHLMGWSSTSLPMKTGNKAETERMMQLTYGFLLDTLLALEAMTEFSYRETNRDFYNLQLEFACSQNSSFYEVIRLNKTNFATLAAFKVSPAYGQIKTRATGTGYAHIAMDTTVHLEKPYQVTAIGPQYPSFFVELSSMRFWGRNASHMEMVVCYNWLRTDLAPQSGMANVIIEIPTGFIISRDTIEWMYTAGFVGLKRVQFYNQRLVTFFEYIGTNRTCFSFVADRWYPTANTSIDHLLMIQEYSEFGMLHLSAYNVFTLFQLHICQVCGSFQCPYCMFYNSAHTIKTSSFLTTTLLASIISYLFARRLYRANQYANWN